MSENHQDKVIKSIDDLKKVVEENNSSNTLLESVKELSNKFSENTEEVRKLSSFIQQEKRDKNIEKPFEMLFIPSRGLFYPSRENYLLLNQLFELFLSEININTIHIIYKSYKFRIFN
jgi:hypothetical protein